MKKEWPYKNCPEIIARPHSAVFEEASSPEEWDARMNRRLTETTLGLKKNIWILGTYLENISYCERDVSFETKETIINESFLKKQLILLLKAFR